MSSESKAKANRLKIEEDIDDDDDDSGFPPLATTAAPASSTSSASDIAHRKPKPGNRKSVAGGSGVAIKQQDGENGGGNAGSVSSAGAVKNNKRTARSGSEDANGNGNGEVVKESKNGIGNGHHALHSPPPAPASSSSNGKVSKRRKVNHACVYCRRSHMTCDDGHLCRDEVRDAAKKTKSERDHSTEEASPSSPMNSPHEMNTNTGDAQDLTDDSSGGGSGGVHNQNPQPLSMPPPRNSLGTPTIIAPSPVSASQRANLNSQNPLGVPEFSGVSQQDWNPYHHPMMFSNPEAASEYDLMNEFFLDSIYNDNMFLDGNMFQDSGFGGNNIFNPGALSSSSGSLGASAENGASSSSANNMNGLRANAMLPQAAPSPMIRPASVKPTLEKAKELYYLTAADPPKDGIPEDRMKQVLKAKHDAGLLKPFNYINGYRRLQKYMDENMSPSSKLRIQKSLERFRPKFREKTHQLTDIDLIFVEEWFERSLMEYDRVFAAMAVPACLWRRTGEIFRGNKEFAELIHVPIEQMRDGKLAIYELIAEDSAVSYWEKFGAIAFDPSQKAMLTTCYLKNPDPNAGNELIHCCFSFTIRRDSSHIPAMIIGNFLPIP